MQLERLSNESDFDYHKRLIYGKLVDKTLADIDYSELSDLIYGQSYSSDVARRMMYGSRKTLELMEDVRINGIEDTAILSDIETKMRELRKEQQKFYDQRREYNKTVVSDARTEHLEASLIEAAKSLDEKIGALFPHNDGKTRSLVNWDTSEAVLVLSDWHYGMTTDNVFNRYNTEVCKQRVKNVVKNAINRITLHNCKKLHVVLLGDFIHGAIHVSARVASEELVVEQLMHVSEILAQAINELSCYVEDVIVYSTYGNHGRVVSTKNDNIHRDNIERLIGWWLEQRLINNERVTFCEDTDGFLIIDAYGHDVCAIHGDIDSVRSSPRLITTLMQKKLQKNIECILLGDKHHRESFEELGVTSILCGALCGTDDYANDKRLFSTPSQLLLIFNQDGLDAEYRLMAER